MKKRPSLRLHSTPLPAADDRVPRMVARGIYRKLRAQGFTDAEITAVADEMVDHCEPDVRPAASAP